MNPQDISFAQLAIFLFVMLLIFLIVREIIMWYWKINARLRVQESILNELIHINHKLTFFKDNLK